MVYVMLVAIVYSWSEIMAERFRTGTCISIFMHIFFHRMLDLQAKLPDLFLSEDSTNRVLFRYQIRSFGWLNSTGYLKNVDVIGISNDFIEHVFQVITFF